MYPYVLQGSGCPVAWAANATVPVPFQYCVIYVPVDTTVTLIDRRGATIVGMVLLAGYHALNPYIISSISGGTLYLIHNYDQPIDQRDINTNNSPYVTTQPQGL